MNAQRSLELPVRMGMQSGEADERDGDWFGPTLNRAARITVPGLAGAALSAVRRVGWCDPNASPRDPGRSFADPVWLSTQVVKGVTLLKE